MKNRLRHVLVPIKPLLEALVQLEAAIAARWAAAAHGRLMRVQWGLPPQPEHFNHLIDLYYQWRHTRRGWWVERGVFSSLVLRPGGRMLELACGDGFNARHFYSNRCAQIVACDFDLQALATARRWNPAPNVTYVLADIRTTMPAGSYDNVVWDAAIEHFTPAETEKILKEIRARLHAGGVLSGHTIVERPDGKKSLSHHEYEFKDKSDLRRFLTPHFANVTVFETIHPERHNLYFWASDGVLPFQPGWPLACIHRAAGP